MYNTKPWIPLFSQTGSEIANIIDELDIKPLMIFCNSKVNIDLRLFEYNLYFFNTLKDLEPFKCLLQNNLVTLHGFLRILPENLITENMYNGHPGLITKYPELKGFNPQEKAYQLKLDVTGSVIHKVIPEVDAGEVVLSSEISIKDLSLDDVYANLKQCSLELWLKFLKEELKC